LDGLVDDLFGSIKKDRATQTETGRKGAIEVSDGDLIGTPCPIYLDHVALDRITGFAADAKKFSTCGLASPAFSVTLRVHFGLSQLRRVAFLGFLLRDLQDGLLWAGSGVTRGFGHIHGASITAATLDLSEQFEIPENLARQAQARPGRRRLTLPGPVAFHDLDWVWQRAEEAWREALPTEAA
jgi:hypothetical protein